jgi:hypothetical protein
MSSPRIRIQVGVLIFVLLPAVAGVVAVHASPTCERFVRTYVTTPVRNRVSKSTVAAWAKWRVGHPNWKPNPKLHRPKYVMTREEAVRKVDFACSVPTVPSTLEILFTPADFEGPPPIVDLPPMETTEITFEGYIPPEVAELPPMETTPGNMWPPLAPFIPPILEGAPVPSSGTPALPIVPPTPPPIGGSVPEPPTFLLVALGIGTICLFRAGRVVDEVQNVKAAR